MDSAGGGQEQEWLTKAGSDLASAERLGLGDSPILDTAVYHCHQAGEKSLKAVLVWKKAELRRTHDLRVLLDDIVDELPELESLRDLVELLTPYAVLYRYPGEIAQPTSDEFREALAAARKILTMVRTMVG